ncbi:hypothetical protein GCM10010970_34490 [Silvimonas iriomotensis]|uniref:TonB C-terminal domain-containing protein n=1 Tax=Silvimonas iriomotensis TaxID=449662 RepID=A0ABQ2PD28_9NEIS|nr:hypothetical protein GCM10010970_34490 [Silvimonas iriomotensis]
MLLALLCALLAHGCLLLWRGLVGQGVVPAERMTVHLAQAPGKPAVAPSAAPTAAPAMPPAKPAPPKPSPKNQSAPLVQAAPQSRPQPQATPAIPQGGQTTAAEAVTAQTATAGSAHGNAEAPGETAPTGPTESARIVYSPKPPLPDAARRRGETGTVVLRIRVNEQGVADVGVLQSSGSARLDESARSTAQQTWRFVPATRDGRKVAGEIVQPVEFRLTD